MLYGKTQGKTWFKRGPNGTKISVPVSNVPSNENEARKQGYWYESNNVISKSASGASTSYNYVEQIKAKYLEKLKEHTDVITNSDKLAIFEQTVESIFFDPNTADKTKTKENYIKQAKKQLRLHNNSNTNNNNNNPNKQQGCFGRFCRRLKTKRYGGRTKTRRTKTRRNRH